MYKSFFENVNINMKILYYVIFTIFISISWKNKKIIIENYALKYGFRKKLLTLVSTIIILILIYSFMYLKSINLFLCIITNAIGQCIIWVLTICLWLDEEFLSNLKNLFK